MTLKKYLDEFKATITMVTIGCGTSMLEVCSFDNGCGYFLTAFAFGLVIVGMAYCVGNVSGCHINPAVSLAVLLNGGMSGSDFVGYVISQCLGAFAGTGILAAIFGAGDVTDQTGGFGANALGGVNGSIAAGLIVEIVLTFIFVLTILGVTSKKASHGSFGGLIIGFTLTLVHILGIGLTGTSVNPARSIAPAIAAAINGNDAPLKCLWVFIAAPLIGAALAAFIHMYFERGVESPAPAAAKGNSNNNKNKSKKK